MVTLILYIMVGYIGINFSDSLAKPFNIALALMPAMLWFVFSHWRERFVQEPRRRLSTIFITSALVANAIGIPLLDTLAPEEWLSATGTIDKVIGYAVTVGIVQEMLKYLVVRYTVSGMLNIRLDSVAYCAASAIGYVTVINLHLAFTGTPSPDVTAIRIFSNTALHMSTSALIAFGFAEVQFNPKIFFVMPLTMVFSAFITGIAIAARSSMVNANFFLGHSATRPIMGLLFSVGLVTAIMLTVGFLFSNLEKREQETVAGREV